MLARPHVNAHTLYLFFIKPAHTGGGVRRVPTPALTPADAVDTKRMDGEKGRVDKRREGGQKEGMTNQGGGARLPRRAGHCRSSLRTGIFQHQPAPQRHHQPSRAVAAVMRRTAVSVSVRRLYFITMCCHALPQTGAWFVLSVQFCGSTRSHS